MHLPYSYDSCLVLILIVVAVLVRLYIRPEQGCFPWGGLFYDYFDNCLTYGKSRIPKRRKKPKETGLPPKIPHKPTPVSPDWNKIVETKKDDDENIKKETEKDDDVKIDFLPD